MGYWEHWDKAEGYLGALRGRLGVWDYVWGHWDEIHGILGVLGGSGWTLEWGIRLLGALGVGWEHWVGVRGALGECGILAWELGAVGRGMGG